MYIFPLSIVGLTFYTAQAHSTHDKGEAQTPLPAQRDELLEQKWGRDVSSDDHTVLILTTKTNRGLVGVFGGVDLCAFTACEVPHSARHRI